MKPRINCYKIGRIEYVTWQERYDWACVMSWMGLTIAVVAFWVWAGVRAL